MEAERLRLSPLELKELGLCKHNCGKPSPAERDECYTCRSRIRRLKMREGPSDFDLVKKERDLLQVENADLKAKTTHQRDEIVSLRTSRDEDRVKIERLQSEINTLARALVDKDALRAERDALREERDELREKCDFVEKSHRILNESVLSNVVSWNSESFDMSSAVSVSEASHTSGQSTRDCFVSQNNDLNSSFSSLNLADERHVALDHHAATPTCPQEPIDAMPSASSGGKRYKPQNCEACGHRIYKRGKKSAGIDYCACNN